MEYFVENFTFLDVKILSITFSENLRLKREKYDMKAIIGKQENTLLSNNSYTVISLLNKEKKNPDLCLYLINCHLLKNLSKIDRLYKISQNYLEFLPTSFKSWEIVNEVSHSPLCFEFNNKNMFYDLATNLIDRNTHVYKENGSLIIYTMQELLLKKQKNDVLISDSIISTFDRLFNDEGLYLEYNTQKDYQNNFLFRILMNLESEFFDIISVLLRKCIALYENEYFCHDFLTTILYNLIANPNLKLDSIISFLNFYSNNSAVSDELTSISRSLCMKLPSFSGSDIYDKNCAFLLKLLNLIPNINFSQIISVNIKTNLLTALYYAELSFFATGLLNEGLIDILLMLYEELEMFEEFNGFLSNIKLINIFDVYCVEHAISDSYNRTGITSLNRQPTNYDLKSKYIRLDPKKSLETFPGAFYKETLKTLGQWERGRNSMSPFAFLFEKKHADHMCFFNLSEHTDSKDFLKHVKFLNKTSSTSVIINHLNNLKLDSIEIEIEVTFFVIRKTCILLD